MSPKHTDRRRPFTETVKKKQTRKIRGRRNKEKDSWFGIGVMGLVGWSLSMPVVGGALLGVWLDETLGEPVPWTLVGLIAGFALGIISAVYWILRENRDIFPDEDKNKDGEGPEGSSS